MNKILLVLWIWLYKIVSIDNIWNKTYKIFIKNIYNFHKDFKYLNNYLL